MDFCNFMDIQKSIILAISHHNAGRLLQAEDLYRIILKMAVEHPVASTLLAKISLSNGNIEEAGELLSSVLKNYPTYMKGQTVAGDYYHYTGKPRMASNAYKRALLLDPNQSTPLIALGNLMQISAPIIASILKVILRKYVQASIIQPDSIPALNNIAAVHLKLKRPLAALETLKLVTNIDPFNVRATAYKTVGLFGMEKNLEADYFIGFGSLTRSMFIKLNDRNTSIDKFNAELIEALRNHPNRTSDWDPSKRAIRGGTIVPNIFGNKGAILKFFEVILKKTLDEYISELSIDPDHPFLSTKRDEYRIDAWANFLGPDNHQSSHIHNQGWMSGVYYVTTAPEEEENPDAGWIEFNRPGYGLPMLGGEKVIEKIKPEPGMVIMFPSYVWHGTIPFSDLGERISIAFDLHI
jgi:tetratricopeptide (TPR) repeat protein